MRLRGRQGRFVAMTVGGWTMWRAWSLWPVAAGLAGGFAADRALPPLDMATPFAAPVATFEAYRPALRPMRHASSPIVSQVATFALAQRAIDGPAAVRAVEPAAFASGADFNAQRLLRRATFAQAAPSPPPEWRARPAERRLIEASAYVFARPGSGSGGLAPGGTLGASQAAARIAIALDRGASPRLAAALRIYAPLGTAGKEAAAGFDWHPLPHQPLRLSIERRIGLDHAGRDAWSAYVAGGFYGERGGLAIDGYGQAGVVGARRRDGFVDGALRAGRRIGALTVGAGAWGAAQPGAERLDVGPRAALSLPIDRHRLTLAIEGRLRIAGRAAPGSGVAMTLAADL